MKLAITAQRSLRVIGMVTRAMLDKDRPLLAQIVPMRRCNLTCAYCNEYDRVSKPVAVNVVHGWLDKLTALGTQITTVSGGEPLLHPALDQIVTGIRARGMIAGLITNGYFLQRQRIEELNRAGLEYLQISIDNVTPDAVSKKSLEVLDSKLSNLSRYARFQVNVNVVLGANAGNPGDALVIARRARELGLSTSVGLLHDGSGQLVPLTAEQTAIYDQLIATGRGAYTRIHGFQRSLIAGQPNQWQCRAGARYLYLCENGLVSYCSQRRGEPGIPLAQYTRAHIQEAFDAPKDCAPYCTIGCVHRISALDRWRTRLPRFGK